MATIPAIFWSGSTSVIGKTPFGYFDNDTDFEVEAPKIADWIAKSFGYPVMQVELNEQLIYAMIEEAVTEYSSQVNEFLMRDNMLYIQGIPTASGYGVDNVGGGITQDLIQGGPLPYVISISQTYGEEAGAGGNVDWKRGYITTAQGVQEYDLIASWSFVSESGNAIEIKRIFHDRTPAISRGGFGFGDTGVGPTDASNNLLGEFGWAGYDGGLNGTAGNSTAGQFMIMPVYETLERVQAIMFNDEIRRSQFSFELINNKLKLFPVPFENGFNVYFEYIVTNDRTGQQVNPSGSVVADVSNAPYTMMTYANINDVGRRWIRKFALALAKITLGNIRSKYEAIPSPGAEVRLDGLTLRQEGMQEKEVLYGQLRESLQESGRHAQMLKADENEAHAARIMSRVPMGFVVK